MAEMKDPDSREFHFTAQDFQRVSKMIHEHAGITLSDSKQELVYSRLSRRLRATGTRTFGEYLALLNKGNEKEWEAFVNSLTTNLTAFFREPHHFPLLAEHLQKLGGSKPIVLWCSASSTGEEPYSMAMTAIETFGATSPPVTIIATDLDTNVIETARNGVYPMERVEKLEPERLKRFFFRGEGSQQGFVKVRPELQRMITFRKLNLLDANWSLHGGLDAIFCRNVMIYFDKDTQLAILKRFAPLLNENGLMFAGHSENFYHADAYFKLRGKTVYELSPKYKLAHPQTSGR
ncbi:MAG: chemotaxis protein CheR [Sideroxydans sp.]|nr:chemotaxis protein CheR [Sideroxydans sp.]